MKSKLIGEKEAIEKFIKPTQVIDVQSLKEIAQITFQGFQVLVLRQQQNL